MSEITGPDMDLDDLTPAEPQRQVGTLSEEAAKYKRMREEFDNIEAHYKEKKKELREQTEFLFDYMEAEMEKTKSYDDGSRLTRVTRRQAIIKDRDAAWQSLDDLGLLESMTKTDLRMGDIGKILRERHDNGEEIPEGFELLNVKQIQYTRPKEG